MGTHRHRQPLRQLQLRPSRKKYSRVDDQHQIMSDLARAYGQLAGEEASHFPRPNFSNTNKHVKEK
jgi:hypothetical protein